MLFGSSNVSASDNDDFYINNAYFKGDGKYDVVVYSSDRDTLQIYVNDENPVKTKVNKEGWATFQKVKLSNLSKLSFAKKVGWFKYYPVNHVEYISVNSEHVKLTDTGPLRHYDEFYDWATTNLEFEIGDFSSSNYKRYSEYRWKNINSECDYQGTYSDGEKATFWDKTCLSDEYKEYIEPSTFNYGSTLEDSGICPSSDAGNYNWICSRFGDMLVHIKGSQQANEDNDKYAEKEKARAIYNEISLKHE